MTGKGRIGGIISSLMNDLLEEVVANVESDSDGVVMNNVIYDLVNVVVDNSEADVHGDEAGKIGGDEMGNKEVINGRGEYHGESREIDDGNDIFGDYDNGDGGGGDAGDDSGDDSGGGGGGGEDEMILVKMVMMKIGLRVFLF